MPVLARYYFKKGNTHVTSHDVPTVTSEVQLIYKCPFTKLVKQNSQVFHASATTSLVWEVNINLPYIADEKQIGNFPAD